MIIGAGLAGLSCAIKLTEAGKEILILEADDAVGGRVRTDEMNGFLLDRGFQVYLDAYPTAGTLLALGALELGTFEPGALVHKGGQFRRIMDVWRRPQWAPISAIQPIGSLADKLKVAQLRMRLLKTSIEDIWAKPDRPTADYLRDLGFSAGMIDSFFRPFYGGIFLERELETSNRMFEFTFKMFAQGSATLPAKGMGMIPKQLSDRLPAGSIRLNQRVKHVRSGLVELESGERIEANQVVIATDSSAANAWLGRSPDETRWQAVSAIYFDAPKSPLREPIIALNGEKTGLVNNVCVPSDVRANYAPPNRALVSVSVLGQPKAEGLEEAVKAEMNAWFGPEVNEWRHLKTDHLRKALPIPSPAGQFPKQACEMIDGLVVAGDHLTCASIEGAIISGLAAAEVVLANLKNSSSAGAQ